MDKNSLRSLLLPFCIAFFIPIQSKEMIILLDYHNQELRHTKMASASYPPTLGCMTYTFLTALYQKAAPILVSRSLVENVLKHRQIFFDCLTQSAEVITKKYGLSKNYTLAGSADTFKKHCLYTYDKYRAVNNILALSLANNDQIAESESILNSNKLKYSIENINSSDSTPRKRRNQLKKRNEQAVENAVYELSQNAQLLEDQAPSSLHYSDHHSLEAALYREMSSYVLCAYAPLDATHYYAKQVNDELYLLIPRDYLKPYVLNNIAYMPTLARDACTDIEKATGLKLNHLQDYTIKSNVQSMQNELVNSSNNSFLGALQSLFVTNNGKELSNAFTKQKGKDNNKWSFYVAGHGLGTSKHRIALQQLEKLEQLYLNPKQQMQNNRKQQFVSILQTTQTCSPNDNQINSLPAASQLALLKEAKEYHKLALSCLPPFYENIICSLPLKEFQQFLLFCNNAIETSLLVYTSCFSGGEHLIKPYRNGKSVMKLNYDIITGATSDNSSYQEAPLLFLPPYSTALQYSDESIKEIARSFIDPTKRALRVKTNMRFKEFFNHAKYKQRDLHKAMYLVHPYSTEQGLLNPNKISNIAHIRKGGTTSFKVLRKGNSLLVFSSSKKEQNRKLDMQDAIKDGRALLLEKNLCQSLNFDKNKALPAIISLKPGRALHAIESIYASQHSLSEVVKAFMAIPDLTSAKAFSISSLLCKNNNEHSHLGNESSLLLTDVYIVRNVYTSDAIKSGIYNSLYFTYKNQSYHLPINCQGCKLQPLYMNKVKAELLALFS